MDAIKTKRMYRFKTQSGFTLIEVLVSIVILGVGILGFLMSIDSVFRYNRISENMTQATLSASNKLEELKRMATNEPTGGGFGFSYMIDTASGYLSTLTAVDNWTYTGNDTDGDITRTWTLEAYPAGGSNPSFLEPLNVDMVQATVTTEWLDDKSQTRGVTLKTLMHRRQFLNIN